MKTNVLLLMYFVAVQKKRVFLLCIGKQEVQIHSGISIPYKKYEAEIRHLVLRFRNTWKKARTLYFCTCPKNSTCVL